MKVAVYFNLHKRRYSVKALEGEHKGRVVARARAVALEMVSLTVGQAGRQRVLREGKKNVHAFAKGELLKLWNPTWRLDVEWKDQQEPFAWQVPIEAAESFIQTGARHITYNPYKYDSFVVTKSKEPVHRAGAALLIPGQMYARKCAA